MAKARRQVEERCKQVDIIFELLDARLPLSSRNPMINQIIQKKPRLVLLTKTDLADPQASQEWSQYFQKQQQPALWIDAKAGKGMKRIISASEQVLAPLFAARAKKGIRLQRMRAMIIGIPNVGKSSLINRLARRAATQTADRPGVTKAQQWIRIGQRLELLDTPGILWPKFDDEYIGLRLAASGAIREEILPLEEVALFVLDFLQKRYPGRLNERYRVSEGVEAPALLEEIGRRRGCLQKGGVVDLEKASELLLQELRGGLLGRITLEWPEEVESK
jgi:ribosome biogenesis GTPase A